jgi:DNA-binding LacI/PurR family transcriptional regulator
LTIKDIAKISGVSPATISRVLNNKKEVNEQTRQMVMKVINDNNFFPNMMARNIIKKRSYCISLIIINADKESTFINPFYSEIIFGIMTRARQHGYHIQLNSYVSSNDYDTISSLYKSKRIEGFIVIGSNINDSELIRSMNNEQIPYIVTTKIETPKVYGFVDIENKTGGKIAVNYLQKLGHKKIAVIAASNLYVSHKDRLEGYKSEIDKVLDDYIVVVNDYDILSGSNAMNRLLELPERPTAIFATGDFLAIGAIRAIKKAGLKVPDDISVLGFDDIDLSQEVTPALTTIRQPVYEKGYEACGMIIKCVEKQPVNREKYLPIEIMVRDSTKII